MIMKKIWSFLGLCGWVLGVIGGIGYACYSHAYLIAVAVAVLGILSFDKVRGFVRELTEA